MNIKDMRYNVMLALYFPILLYAFSTFDVDEESYVVEGLQPVVVGEETVVLGQPFEARAFLALTQQAGQRLTAAGALEAVGDTLFRMSTDGLLADAEQQASVDYSGRFSFQQVDGEPVEIPVVGRFEVRRPEVVVESEALQALYRQTLNRLRIDVPGLEDRTLRLYADGRSVESRSIAVSPRSETAAVRVYLPVQDGEPVYLGEKEFAVIDPPRPELRVLSNGREVTPATTVPKARAVLDFEITPDAAFERRYAQDARYRLGQATVYLRRGKTASTKIGTVDVSDGRLVLTRMLRNAEAGDQVTVVLDQVVRINHAGATITVPFNRSTRTFGFTLS